MIYFVQSGGAEGPIKIGFTAGDPIQRLAQLQTGSPEELQLIGVVSGGEIDERELHEHFAEHRIRGEWFKLSDEMRQLLLVHGYAPGKSIVGAWSRMIEVEPRLADLYYRAASIKDDEAEPSFCANRYWYGGMLTIGLRDELLDLVGWGAPKHELRTPAAYDIAYETIYAALPDCRNCGCWQ